jgi:hypothetical protein
MTATILFNENNIETNTVNASLRMSYFVSWKYMRDVILSNKFKYFNKRAINQSNDALESFLIYMSISKEVGHFK